MQYLRFLLQGVGAALVLLVAAGIGWLTHPYWLPGLDGTAASAKKADAHDHGHEHGHAHDETSALELSAQARRNIGLTPDKIRPIELQSFTRTFSVPALIVERPGRSKVKIAAPTSGIITEVLAVNGESIQPGRQLFKMKLIHEDLVKAQTDYLETLGKLDVEEKEIARLKPLVQSGTTPEKLVVERQYEQYKLQAIQKAQRESLSLHGLNAEQVQQIDSKRQLLSEFVIKAPAIVGEGAAKLATNDLSQSPSYPKDESSIVVQQLNVTVGEFVEAGATLCVLVDFERLYIEGQAFEQDAPDLVRAAKNGWKVTAMFEEKGKPPQIVADLDIVYFDSSIDPDSRAFHFYVGLPNEVLHRTEQVGGHRFLIWRFKPGQRMQLRVPVEKWEKRIVLPLDAVAQDGADYFVFVENGSHFDRRPIHVEYRDQLYAVIANDGSVFPGDRVAMTGAQQMLMALKNKAGGAVDPHAGHNH